MNRIIFSIFSMVISGAPFIGAIQAQSPTPIIVQAASQATQSAPVSSRPTATTNSAALTAAINGLEEIKAANAETLKGMEAFHGREAHEIAVAPAVVTEIQNAVSRVNKQLAPFEQIRKFRVLERDFTIERGELTPTMKVRRSRVLENHKDTVNELYMGKEEMQ